MVQSSATGSPSRLRAERVIFGPLPPSASGALVPGVYTLANYNVYDGPANGTHLAADLVITGDVIRRIESRDGAPATSSAVRYTVDEKRLQLESVCPTEGTKSWLPFTASPSGLSLTTDATHVEIYTNN